MNTPEKIKVLPVRRQSIQAKSLEKRVEVKKLAFKKLFLLLSFNSAGIYKLPILRSKMLITFENFLFENK